MKLFTRDIDKKLFAQYQKGASLENQVVVAKIFNPYGAGRWYLLNSDPSDPDYLWAIVQINGEPETGSVSRKQLENIRVKPFNLPLERDLYFSPINALELYQGLLNGKIYKAGGMTEASENKEMLLNQSEEFEHHAEELESAVKKADHIPAWVVAKSERASTDLSDITHYLDGENEQREEMTEGEEEYADGGEIKWQDAHYGDNALVVSENKMGLIIKPYGRKFHLKFADGTEKTYDASELKFFGDMDDFDRGGKMASGGRLDVGRYYKTTDGRQVRYLGNTKDPEVGTFTSKADGVLKVRYDEIQGQDSLFAEGGEVEEGVDLFKDYDDIPSNVQEVLDNYSDAFEDGDYRELEKANKELGKIGYTFEYGLDGQAYNLRKVGEKGKSEYMAKGGQTDFGDFYEWSSKEVGKKFNSQFDEGFPIVKFLKDSVNKVVESASGVLKNGKTVVFNVDSVEWEESNKMADGGMMEKGGESANIKYNSYQDFVNDNIGSKKKVVSYGSWGASTPLSGATKESIGEQFKGLIYHEFLDSEFYYNYASNSDIEKEYLYFIKEFYNSLLESPKKFASFWENNMTKSKRNDTLYEIKDKYKNIDFNYDYSKGYKRLNTESKYVLAIKNSIGQTIKYEPIEKPKSYPFYIFSTFKNKMSNKF